MKWKACECVKQAICSRIKRLNFGIADAIITTCDNTRNDNPEYRKQTCVRKKLAAFFFMCYSERQGVGPEKTIVPHRKVSEKSTGKEENYVSGSHF